VRGMLLQQATAAAPYSIRSAYLQAPFKIASLHPQ